MFIGQTPGFGALERAASQPPARCSLYACGKYPAAMGRIQCFVTRLRSWLSLMISRHISRLTHGPSINSNVEAGMTRGECISSGAAASARCKFWTFFRITSGESAATRPRVPGTEECSLLCYSLLEFANLVQYQLLFIVVGTFDEMSLIPLILHSQVTESFFVQYSPLAFQK